MTPGILRRRLGNARGFTLIELSMAALIFVVIGLALGSLYLFTARAFKDGMAQAFVQRQGTLVQYELTRELLRASTMEVGECGAAAVPGQSALFSRPSGSPVWDPILEDFVNTFTYWCVYEAKGQGDKFPQLYLCEVADIVAPQPCTGTPRNLLAGAPQGAQLRVSDTTFAPGAPGKSVNMRFDITDGTLFGPLRFGLTATVRN